ncbi:MAG: protease inhibitor I9 family protein, partial [Nocardioidaceae bacterium]
MPARPTLRRAASSLTSGVVAILLCLSVAAVPAAGEPDNPVLRPAGTDGAVTASEPVLPTADYKGGRYVVVLRDQPAASYTGGLKGLKPTGGAARKFVPDSSRTHAYADHLRSTQREVAASVGARRLASYSLTTNGFAADLTAKQAARLAADPRVAELVENELLHVTDATASTGYTTSTDYLGLEGEGGVWDSIGGPQEAGKGTVVGIIDTGIAPENPSFAGDPLGTTSGPAPYRDGDTIVFHKSDSSDFTGVCQAGEQFTADDCSTKI